MVSQGSALGFSLLFLWLRETGGALCSWSVGSCHRLEKKGSARSLSAVALLERELPLSLETLVFLEPALLSPNLRRRQEESLPRTEGCCDQKMGSRNSSSAGSGSGDSSEGLPRRGAGLRRSEEEEEEDEDVDLAQVLAYLLRR